MKIIIIKKYLYLKNGMDTLKKASPPPTAAGRWAEGGAPRRLRERAHGTAPHAATGERASRGRGEAGGGGGKLQKSPSPGEPHCILSPDPPQNQPLPIGAKNINK